MHLFLVSNQTLTSALEIHQIIILATCAFLAGFIDAIVGGGGLIQLPALLMTLPNFPIATLFGTNKIASIMGTSWATFQYRHYLRPIFFAILPGVISAGLFAFLGAQSVKILEPQILRPLVIVLLICVAIYTNVHKNFGNLHKPKLDNFRQAMAAATPSGSIAIILIGATIGFYDGFFGPGTGSFLIFATISILGFDFLTASATAKVINLMTNFTAIIAFLSSGNVFFSIAIPMSICNITGSYFGARLAILRGNQFIRYLFMAIITIFIFRLGYDLIFTK